VATQLRSENRWTKLWSLLHHGFVFGAATLSGGAALVLQLKSIDVQPPVRSDVATVLAAASSLIGIISVSGGFATKWRANRMTKGTLEQVQIDLMDPACDLADIRKRLKEMKQVHHLAIVGESSPQERPTNS